LFEESAIVMQSAYMHDRNGSIELPLSRERREVIPEDQTTSSSRRARGQLIAVIDDDESIQASVCDLIESKGFEAQGFGSAEEFLAYDLHCEVGCLITDIRMPKMSGLQLQARLKEEECDIPIIFITAYGDAGMRIQAMREGAVEFFAKPFDHRLMLKTVRAALDL
jgi:two-component system, LuxR family, response regulator FixJ